MVSRLLTLLCARICCSKHRLIQNHVLRCLPVFAQVSDQGLLGLVHLSAFLNALAGVVYLSAPATLSAAWDVNQYCREIGVCDVML